MDRAMNAKAVDGKAPKLVNIALQGGGSHGAFTWGVLDRLLNQATNDAEGLALEGLLEVPEGARLERFD